MRAGEGNASIVNNDLNVHLHRRNRTSLFLRICSELAETGTRNVAGSGLPSPKGPVLLGEGGRVVGSAGDEEGEVPAVRASRGKGGPRPLGKGVGTKTCPLMSVTQGSEESGHQSLTDGAQGPPGLVLWCLFGDPGGSAWGFESGPLSGSGRTGGRRGWKAGG